MCLSEDSFPIISQLKSLIFLLHCDTFGSLQTQIAFSKQCVFISQIRSLIQWLFYNDISGAKQTQTEFYHESILPFPILSQLISIVCLLCCDSYSALRVQQKCLNKLTNLIFIPIRFIYYIFNYKASVGRQLSVTNTSTFSTWMGDNFAHIPLNALTLVGTHNAHTYKLRRGTSFFYNFACCQNLSIYRQLICGARCLDIRLCNFENELWCAHGFQNSVRFIDVVRQTLRFIKTFDSEVVILRCKTEWDWRKKINNPVMRSQLINVILNCEDAEEYCAPLAFCEEDILSINIGELTARKWNIILFHEFEYGAYRIISSWTETQSEFANDLMKKVKQWIGESVDVVGNKKMYLSLSYDDGIGKQYIEEIVDDDVESKILYLVNGQITPVINWKYVLFMLMTGFCGLSCDVELVNAEMLYNIEPKELFKLNVWDMDFLHPLLVGKIIDTNLRYCATK